MEIKTCEQYVLAQLYEQQDENDRLSRELEYRDKRIAELEAEVKTIEAAHDSPIQEAIRAAGRKDLYSGCTGYGVGIEDGDGVKAFDDWCLENVRKYGLPKGVTVLDFIKEFAPELREDYDERVAEVRE